MRAKRFGEDYSLVANTAVIVDGAIDVGKPETDDALFIDLFKNSLKLCIGVFISTNASKSFCALRVFGCLVTAGRAKVDKQGADGFSVANESGLAKNGCLVARREE